MDITNEPPNLPPPPPPFATPTELDADEVDVDLAEDEEDQLSRDTLPEGVEYLGRYASIEGYLRDMIEPEVSKAIAPWFLDCIDWRAVQDRFEGDGSRLLCEHGQVFKLSLKANPKPTPGDDPPPPWMPTRGC